MLLQKCTRDLKPLTPSTTTSCQCTEVFAFLVTKLMEEERVDEWALCSDLDTREEEENALSQEELIPPSQALPAAWLAASRWLPFWAVKVWHQCLLRVVSKSTVAPWQELQASTAFPQCRLSVQPLGTNREHNTPVRWSGATANTEMRLCHLIVHLQTFDLGAIF